MAKAKGAGFLRDAGASLEREERPFWHPTFASVMGAAPHPATGRILAEKFKLFTSARR